MSDLAPMQAYRAEQSRKLALALHEQARREAVSRVVANWFAGSVDSLIRQHDEITTGIAELTAQMDATDARIAATLADYRSVA